MLEPNPKIYFGWRQHTLLGMPNQYPHFRGGSERCTQATPLVKARNGKKIKMLNLKFAWISDPAANTSQTAVRCDVELSGK